MTSARRRFRSMVLKILVLSLSLLLTVCCSTVFFDTPQPVDSRNLGSVPKKLQGHWKLTGKTMESTITIDNTSYHIISIEKNCIPKAKADTSSRYRIKDGKIFSKDDEFNKGYPFHVVNDTLFYNVCTDDMIILSDSVLLRRAKNCYVLNLRRGDWWEIVFIQKKKNKEIHISYPFNYDVVEMKSRCNVAVLDSARSDSTFFHAEFTKRSIEKVIPRSNGGVIYILRPDSTFETPN